MALEVSSPIIDKQKAPEDIEVISGSDIKLETASSTEGQIIKTEAPKIEQLIRIPLSKEEESQSTKEFAKKYGLEYNTAFVTKKRGYRVIDNPEFLTNSELSKIKKEQDKKYLNEVTPIEVNSIESVFGNEEQQKIIKTLATEYENTYKFNNTKNEKKFKLQNGNELSYGDIIILNKLIEFKVFRNDQGVLMMFDKNENVFAPFKPTVFFGQHKSFTLRGDVKDVEKISKRGRYYVTPMETFAPQIYKKNFFEEKDFGIRAAGSISYQINGPHERRLSHSSPYAVFTNNNGLAKYYLGRDKFVGTDKKINHETVRVSMLDENTGAVTDTIHGRKIILYTFPLLNKEEYEAKKEKVIESRVSSSQGLNINPGNYITTNVNKLDEYNITDYFPKNNKESEKDYANRVSRLSDTSYVMGNFRSFMSKTGLSANNYSWKEQLVLADALTSVEDEIKIINLGKNFGKNGMRTFLSIEQGGKEMGEMIIQLTNSKIIPENLLKDIFEGYAVLLDEAEKLKNKMSTVKEVEGVNSDLLRKMPLQIYDALLLRTKDILLGAYLLAKNGELKGLNVLDVRKATDGVSLMLKILNDLKKEENFSFQEINRTEQNFKYEITDKKSEYKYGLKIFLRPRAEKNAQARVNIELSFDTDKPNEKFQKAFLNKIESHTQNKVMTGSVLRIGIDREEREGGQVSLDIGRSAHSDEELTRTGDVLGNLLAVSSPDGHHTTESFDPSFAQEETFAQIVKLFENYLVNQKI